MSLPKTRYVMLPHVDGQTQFTRRVSHRPSSLDYSHITSDRHQHTSTPLQAELLDSLDPHASLSLRADRFDANFGTMPPTTRSSGKPPPSRIYNTSPTLHQVTFPPRRKVVKTYSKKKGTPKADQFEDVGEDAELSQPSSSTPIASVSTSKKTSHRHGSRRDPKQKTLTQIDWVSASFEGSNIEFSDSEEEKENDNHEEEDEDEEPISSTKRKRMRAKGNPSKRRRTLGDTTEQARLKQDKGKSRRKTLGDAPSASAYHTQTLTQFVGRDILAMVRDSEDEEEGEGFEEWLKEADSPTTRTKIHAPARDSPSRRVSPALKRKGKAPLAAAAGPSTPTKQRTGGSIWEVPSSSQSGTPLSNRMLARYGAPETNKPSPSKCTQEKELITEAAGKAPNLVIQDSYSTAGWESLSITTPSKKSPTKSTPLKDITEEVVAGNDETPSKRASQRQSQRKQRPLKFGKENETPTKKPSQRSQRSTATPTKRWSPRKLSSGKYEIPDSDDEEDWGDGVEDDEPQLPLQDNLQKATAPDAAEAPVEFGDPDDILGMQDSLVYGRNLAQAVGTTQALPEKSDDRSVPQQDEERSTPTYQEPLNGTTEDPKELSIPLSKSQPSASGVGSQQFTHIDQTQHPESIPNYDFQSSPPSRASREEQQSYVDKTQQPGSVGTMLPPSSAVQSEELTHIEKTLQDGELSISYDFEAFPETAPSTQEEEGKEEPYTHIDKTLQRDDVTPRTVVRFQSTPAFIPTPDPPPTATEDRVTATQEEDVESEVGQPVCHPRTAGTPKPRALSVNSQDADDDDFAGEETQGIWKEIESSKDDPFPSGTSHERSRSAETPHTSPQASSPQKATEPKRQKPMRKPMRNLPPSSQTQPIESQRIPLATIQAMGHPGSRSDIILPVATSSLAPLVSGHSLHLTLPLKVPSQVVRLWLFENREVIRYGACAELETESSHPSGQKTWRYFIPQVFELNNPMYEEDLMQEGFIWEKVDRYTYLDPGPVAQLLANLRQALFPLDGETGPETQLTQVNEQEDDATQAREEEDSVPELPKTATPRKQTPNPDSSFSVSEAAEAQLLSEQASHKKASADEILCPSTPLKERPSAPPPTYNVDSIPLSPPRQRTVRPSQATTASQASTPEKTSDESQHLPAATSPAIHRLRPQGTKTAMLPPDSNSSDLAFPGSDSSPPFLISLSQCERLRSSQLLTKSQMLPDSLSRDEGGWDG